MHRLSDLRVPQTGVAALATLAIFAGLPAEARGAPISFGKSALQGNESSFPTSLQWGPDNRLYVAQIGGLIKAYTIRRNAPNDYVATGVETISSIAQIPNHDDNDGSLDTAVTGRLVTGILVTGTAANPVIYVTSSDPRTGGGDPSQPNDTNLDTNSGILSRLTKDGSTWRRDDLVEGLPRSEEEHASNGLALDPTTQTLYIAQGGNTNRGAPSTLFANLPEVALSAAVLAIKLDAPALQSPPYRLPTLHDDRRSAAEEAATDPFGGDNGRNQAVLLGRGAPTDSAPVTVYAPGFRNPYDLVRTSTGRLYTVDNGSNAGWGDVPHGEGGSACTNVAADGGTSDPDSLHRITGPGYYGGHPDPTRGNTANTFDSPPQSPVPSANPQECDYVDPTQSSNLLATFSGSTDGLSEYTASNFAGAMQSNLLAAGFSANAIERLQLSADGASVVNKGTLFSNVGVSPLDATAMGDNSLFPGTIWVADFTDPSAGNPILVFEPQDVSCSAAYDANLDEDHDGFSNADEIDNGTNPCSAADVPPDHDGDHVSDLNDPDDDNDGIPDVQDPFPLDPNNGMATAPNFSFQWSNGETDGGIANLGFTGLIRNGTTNYLSQFDLSKMTLRGAAGVLTVDAVPAGDAFQASNSQQYGFQLGVNANPSRTGPFDVHTRVLAPWSGITPQGYESMGLVVGDGTQDNYAKLVVTAGGGTPGVEFLEELGGRGQGQSSTQQAAPVVGSQAVDLWLRIDPGAGTVTPRYAITSGGVRGATTTLPTVAIPSAWLTGSMGLALGIISTSVGGQPFPATWDLFEAVPVADTGPSPQPPAPPGSSGLPPPTASTIPARPLPGPSPLNPATIPVRNVTVRKGIATFPLACSRRGPRCRGGLVIQTVAAFAIHSARAKRQRVIVGRARYSIAAGRRVLARVRLSSFAESLLAHSHRHSLRVVASVMPTGAARASSQRTVTLRAAVRAR